MNELEKLRTLLVGPEQEVLDDLSRRVEEPDIRTGDIADVLPESVTKSHAQGDGLARSLKDPVELCLKQSFKERPEEYADALYPIMGPAIRKSITETFRAMVQTINQAMEQSLTPKGLKWRIQAWRAGVPFGQYVIQQRLRYQVEQAYLIQKQSGLLIAEAHDEAAIVNRDTDAVSAMFTAIQDFVGESFSLDENSRLQTADMGEFTVWAVHGAHAVLACVIRGVPPRSLRQDLSEILEHIHLNYGSILAEFSGDKTEGLPINEELKRCLVFESVEDPDSGDEAANKKTSPVLWLVVIGVVALLAYWLFSAWIAERQLSRLERVLTAEPGILLTKADTKGGRFFLEGMRDPLAREIDAIVSGVDIDQELVDLRFQSFQSLDEAILLRRLSKLIAQPDNVKFRLDGGVLSVEGAVSTVEQERLRTVAPALGLEQVEFVVDDQVLLNRILSQLKPPRTVNVTVKDAVVLIKGSASLAWLDSARASLNNVPGLVSSDLSEVVSDESVQYENLRAELSRAEFLFVSGVSFRAGETQRLLTFADQAATLQSLADDLDKSVIYRITGHTDTSGSATKNDLLAMRRAEVVRDALLRVSIPNSQLRLDAQVPGFTQQGVRGQRKVVITLESLQ